MKSIKLVLMFISIVILVGTTRASTTIIGQASIIDGDTVEIRGERIRLFGIDAPEAAQMCLSPDGANWPCGRRASFALADHIGSLNLTCTLRGKDRWGRTIATCRSQSGDVQEWMVANGWALAFVRYSRDYIRSQARAKQAKLGMWVGSFQAPWDWRKDRKSPPFEAISGPVE
jgi:endonuclease YncB( thermonuclease family)